MLVRVTVVALLLLALVAGAPFLLRGNADGAESAERKNDADRGRQVDISLTPPPAPVDGLETAPRAVAALAFRGMAIQLSDGYNPQRYLPMIDEIADLGANTVLLTTSGYMEHAKAQAIMIDARKTPSRPELVRIIRHARERDLKVILMPIVLLSHPRGSEWRGVIEPPNWNEWWREYTEFIEWYADAAREGDAQVLIVGSELVSTERSTAQWRKVIEAARARFPGQLGYSANWDHYRPVQFWDQLDVVCMTSYYKLARDEGADLETLIKAWMPIKAEVLGWANEIGKPLILTEVGWCSQEGAAVQPWNYYRQDVATPAGLEEQRRLYLAFVQAWFGVPTDADVPPTPAAALEKAAPGLDGVIWWEWTEGACGPDDYGYCPKNKPAEKVLRKFLNAH